MYLCLKWCSYTWRLMAATRTMESYAEKAPYVMWHFSRLKGETNYTQNKSPSDKHVMSTAKNDLSNISRADQRYAIFDGFENNFLSNLFFKHKYFCSINSLFQILIFDLKIWYFITSIYPPFWLSFTFFMVKGKLKIN